MNKLNLPAMKVPWEKAVYATLAIGNSQAVGASGRGSHLSSLSQSELAFERERLPVKYRLIRGFKGCRDNRYPTHAAIWLMTSSFSAIGFPASSLGGEISKVDRSDAASKNSASLLKWRPGQILRVQSTNISYL